MGSDDNKNNYSPTSTSSGSDPRGRVQNRIGSETGRFQNQQGPLANLTSYNYARGSESDFGTYTDLQNQFRDIYSGGGGGGGAGHVSSGGGGGGHISPQSIGYEDPFNSYAGFTEFSNTGGYSPADIANMRARGIGPVRSAYANAERELMRQRSLQGGYSPNAIAGLIRMAREQGQSAADATQNVEALLAAERQKGRLAGLTGMSGIETSRLGADLQVAQFNAQQRANAAAANAAMAESAAGRRSAASAASAANRMSALGNAAELYGTTPGMSQLFGNQALQAVGMGSQFGNNMVQNEIAAQGIPGRYDTTMNRVQQGVNLGSQLAYPFVSTSRGGGRAPAPTNQMPGTRYQETIPRPRR